MIHIQKGREPHSLTEYRLSTDSASYDGLPTDTKNEIRAYLLREQGSICAYCMARIRMDTVTIEHYIAQHQDGDGHDFPLDYKNMLGVCPGNNGMPYHLMTCDKHRGNTPLTVDPRVAASVGTIKYSTDGRIQSTSADINRDLEETLNLNINFLASNRKAALDSLNKKLKSKREKGEWTNLASQYIKQLGEKKEKDEYTGILLWRLGRIIKSNA